MKDNGKCETTIYNCPFDEQAWGRMEQKVDNLIEGIYSPVTGMLAKQDKMNGRVGKVEAKVWMIVGGLVLGGTIFGILEGIKSYVKG